ncbi:MAG TPA: TPM domain-containing protein [Gammaproteobacteria bacterium]|nr:TPM domain-containing protein [Gammaproteobacteria bacterium]
MIRVHSWRTAAALIAAVLFASFAFDASAQSDASMPPFPALSGPVVDTAHLLPADVANDLTAKLAAYANQSENQLVVVTVPTLNGYPIEYWGYQLGRHWGIGRKGKNTGALLIVDSGEHQVRIEVGYGLEGTLTDAQCDNIIRNVIVPHLKQNDYAGGITAGVDAILDVLGGQAEAEHSRKVREHSSTGFMMFIIILFALWPLASAIFFPGRRGSSLWWWLGGFGGWGGGFGGGGFGGGGFGGGGFSGGGGSFGGGGASGSW